jgi:hypothetical protein
MFMLAAKTFEKGEAGMHCYCRIMVDCDGNYAVGERVLPYLDSKFDGEV